jgi:hypothetical protein
LKTTPRRRLSHSSRRAFLSTCARGTAAGGLAALGLGRALDGSGSAGESGATELLASAQARAGSNGVTSPRLLGLMADVARVPENVSYYRRLIDFCRGWKLNALLISLTDDQGCALRFKSHPELITHRNALTPGEARSLAEYGHRRGVDIIPIIESFGHTRYITGVPQYANLADQPPGEKGHFDGIIPVAPETLRLMTDLYRETAGIFPSRYFHGGCDEVHWGGSELSRQALESRSRAQIWADYLNSLDHVARGLGKEFIVWGDYVLHKEPDILPRLSKDMIVMDWQYYQVDPRPLEQAARKVIETGLRALGAPAVISCRWGPRPGLSALQNIEAYAEAYRRISDPRALGVIVTNWIPCRYIQDSIWDSFAYAAVALTEGGERARASAFRTFVETYYGAEWSDNWGDIFTTIYDVAPAKPPCAPPWMQPILPVPWRNEDELKTAVEVGAGEAPPLARLVSQITAVEGSVRRNFDDFLAFRLSAEYLEYAFWRSRVVAEEAKRPSDRQAATRLIQLIAERDHRLLARLDAEWNKGRPRDAASKLGPVFDFGPGDQLLFTFSQAAAFSDQLAERPEKFARALSEA